MAKSSKKFSKLSFEFDILKYSQPSEGALDLNYYIQAEMKDGTWTKAKIIDCRPLKTLDPKKKRNDSSYEYYVHYMDYDRRMDQWLPRQKIDMTREFIEEENLTKKRKGGDKSTIDKEHEGK